MLAESVYGVKHYFDYFMVYMLLSIFSNVL